MGGGADGVVEVPEESVVLVPAELFLCRQLVEVGVGGKNGSYGVPDESHVGIGFLLGAVEFVPCRFDSGTGNGYLSAYIVGIVLGNSEFPGRKPLVSFFDAVTSLMQIVIFFLLGMLAVPSKLLHSLLPALIIFAFLSFAARPLAVGAVLSPFRKYPFRQLVGALAEFGQLQQFL